MNHGLNERAIEAMGALCERMMEPVMTQITREFGYYCTGQSKDFARRVCNARHALATHTHLTPDAQEACASALDRFLQNPIGEDFGNFPADFVKLASVAVTQSVTAAWIAAVRVGLTERGGEMWLRLDILDDVMLPIGNEVCRERFAAAAEQYARGAVTVEEGFGFLRQMRAALPEGQVLPEEAIRFLEAKDVIVVR